MNDSKFKTEYEPLYDCGFADLTKEEVYSKCVLEFKKHEKRKLLFERFSSFLQKLTKMNLKFQVWIDGSFATKKHEPGDVDALVIIDSEDWFNVKDKDRDFFYKILKNRIETKARYMSDIFITFDNEQREINFYLDLFGTWRDNVRKKGIIRLNLEKHNSYD